MAIREFRLPDVGEGLVEAEIVNWQVAVGDTVKVNDIVVEIETAKSLVELPMPVRRHGHALLVDEGETVDVGTPIIAIDTGRRRRRPPRRPRRRRRGRRPAEAAARGRPDGGAAARRTRSRPGRLRRR